MSVIPTTSTGRIRRFLEIRNANYRNRPNVLDRVHEWIGPDAVAHDLTEHDVEMLLAERDAATERAEKAEARAQYLDEEALRFQRTIDEARKQRDDWQQAFGTAYARAEQAEAALAEMWERLGETHDEWVVRFTDGYGGEQERKRPNELYARKTFNWAQGFDPAAKLLHRVAGQWRDVNNATSRTALERTAGNPVCTCQPNGGMKYHAVNCGGFPGMERAADEQGERPVRCGTECAEGHTYEPGSCEAAVDPDEAIAQNHTDAAHDWGIADA